MSTSRSIRGSTLTNDAGVCIAGAGQEAALIASQRRPVLSPGDAFNIYSAC